MSPTFSVCLPIRNEASWLGGAIESVLAQTYGDFELIIGDNASDDGIEEVIARFDDPRLVHRRFDELVLVNESFNRTVAQARNEWVHTLSADDRMMPDCLERVAAAIERYEDEGVVMVAGSVRRVDEDGKPKYLLGSDEVEGRPFPVQTIRPGIHDARSWLEANAAPGVSPWMFGAVSVRRDIILGSGWYRPDMELCADLELAMRLAVYGPVVWIDEVLLDYTVRGKSATLKYILDDLERNSVTSMFERAWSAVLLLHRERRNVSDEEAAVINGAIARQLLQRAFWHRRMETGHGRLAASATLPGPSSTARRPWAAPSRSASRSGRCSPPGQCSTRRSRSGIARERSSSEP